MSGLEQKGLDDHFSNEQTELIKDKKIFSEVDLKAFTELVADDDDFKILLKGLTSKTVLTDTNNLKETSGETGGLKTTIDTEIGKNKDQYTIFDSEYKNLTKEQEDLYETCVLGAMLKDETDKTPTPDYKALAKAYYLTINPAKAENKETWVPNIEGTYNSASSDMKTETVTKIENATTIEAGKKITEATVTVSAGASLAWMPLETAKTDRTAKIADLTALKAKFTNTDNQTTIQTMIDELSLTTNIESKITDNLKQDKTNKEQHGNRYLITARIAEGFINALNKLTLTPEPTLKLTIDRDKCTIGESTTDADIEADRFIRMNLSVTVETSTTEQKNTQDKAKDTSKNDKSENDKSESKKPEDNKDNDNNPKNNNPKNNKPGPNANDDDNNPESDEHVSDKLGEDVETPEIIALKKDLADNFTINGKKIVRETDISNTIVYKDNIYTLSIQGYTGLKFGYETIGGKKMLSLETSTGGVRKGLFLYDVAKQSADITATGGAKLDIQPAFNSTKTIEALDKQLATNDKDADGKADYKVKSINGTAIDFEYVTTFMKDKTDPLKNLTTPDTFTLNVDANSNIVIPDSQKAGEISQWKKIDGSLTQDTDFVFDGKHQPEKEKKIIHYAQTKVSTTGIPTLTLMNNILEKKTGGFIGIYTEHEEMTTPQFNEIKDEFLANKVEKIFTGTLNKNHQKDFGDNRKITQDTTGKAGKYNFEITFNENDGTQKKVDIPFTVTTDATNTKKYTFGTTSKVVSVDNIAYDISTPIGADGIPSIKMMENQETTLKNAEAGTSKIVASDIFSGVTTDRSKDKNNTYKVTPPAFSLGTIEFDGAGGYKRTVYFGEQKDAQDNILMAGEDKGTIYYDQDYKIIKVEMDDNGTKRELDFGDKTEKVDMKDVLEDDLGTNKGALLTPSIIKKNDKASLQVNFLTPTDTTKDRQTTDMYLERMRAEKQTIFEALKKLSRTDLEDVFILPAITNTDELSYVKQKIVGPNGKGVYKRKMADAYEKGKEKHLEQSIYCKVEGEKIVLCDSEGTAIVSPDNVYLMDYENKDYYKLSIDTKDNKNFDIKKLEKADKDKIIQLETEKVEYDSGKMSTSLSDDTIDLLTSNMKTEFTFANNKHEMCKIYIDAQTKKMDEKQTLFGSTKTIDIVEPGDEKFGSYKKYFAGDERENLAISEEECKAAFQAIYTDYKKEDTGKKIIQVKLRSSTDNKYYYDYMAIEQTEGFIGGILGKSPAPKFSLEKLKGLEDAKIEMKKRLDNLVLLSKIQPSTKGDQLRGVKINNKDNASQVAYLKDKTKSVNITLTDTANNVTKPITITMSEYEKRVLGSNKNVELGTQTKVDCTLKFKDDIPFLTIEVVTK